MRREQSTAPIVRFQNVSGHRIHENDVDGHRSFTKDAVIEFRPESEKLTERQRERQEERIRMFSKDPRFHRLADRRAGLAEDETPQTEASRRRVESLARAAEHRAQASAERRERERIDATGL